MPASFTVDDRELQAFLKRYTQREVEIVLTKAGSAGARAALPIVRAAVPIGTSKRVGQYYRKMNLTHGTLRASVRSRKIRRRGVQSETIGWVIGPMGKDVASRRGFIRVWVAGGTRPHLIRRGRGGRIQHPGQAANHWAYGPLESASEAAAMKAEAKLRQYAEGRAGV